MSEEQNLQLTNLIDKEVENKKRVAWGGLGVQIYHSELSLQLVAQEISKKLITEIPTNKIADAEKALADVRTLYRALVESRKNVTSKLDAVTDRAMLPEKGVLAAIEKNVAEIIKAKKQQEEERKTQDNKDKELKQVAEKVRVYVADMHASYLNAQAKLLADSYKHALDKEIGMESLTEYLTKIKGRVTIASMTTPSPKIAAIFNTQEDVDAEILRNFIPWTAQKYVDGFQLDLKNKYSDWELALKNKETAAEISTKELAETIDAINDNKEQEVIGAKLDTFASPVQESGVKELKRPYKIPEPETMDQAYTIMNAFIVNKKLCIPHLTKIKPVNFGIKQMMAALEGIKNNDENFAFTGLVFTQIEKL